MEQLQKSAILVIVGITGDLSRRKLLPAIREIASMNVMPTNFRIIGVTRRDIDLEEVLPEGDSEFLRNHLELFKMDLDNPEDYRKLGHHIYELEQSYGEATQRLFYLSVPPLVSQPIISLLGSHGFAQHPDTKLLLEKPFGTDLESANNLIDQIKQHFQEDQLYRIDHYLAKEMAQNLVVFRSSNPLFTRTWNKDFITSIEIISTQTLDIEGRAHFYEQTGALRDLVQSHLLQLAALTLMDVSDSLDEIPARRLKALRNLTVNGQAIRGQYDTYREQVDNPSSVVETFTSLTLQSSDPAWEGVPIIITTGKALAKQTTEIRLNYHHDATKEPNQLILRVQPDEGIEVHLLVKEPGYTNKVQRLPLTFSYQHHFDSLPEAYERVFVDAMRGDHTLFTTSDEVVESWRILKPVQEAWQQSPDDLKIYPVGSDIAALLDAET